MCLSRRQGYVYLAMTVPQDAFHQAKRILVVADYEN